MLEAEGTGRPPLPLPSSAKCRHDPASAGERTKSKHHTAAIDGSFEERRHNMKVIGTVFTSFKGTDGSDVSGTTLYVTEPIAPDKGKGERADKFFLSAKKLASMTFVPSVDDAIEVYYNRFGKPEKIIKLGVDDDI